MRIERLTEETKKNILENLLQRSPNQYGQYQSAVDEILADVKENGDQAILKYTKKFDKAELSAKELLVTEDEIKEAYQQVDSELIRIMKESIANVKAFHEKQLPNSWIDTKPNGSIL